MNLTPHTRTGTGPGPEPDPAETVRWTVEARTAADTAIMTWVKECAGQQALVTTTDTTGAATSPRRTGLGRLNPAPIPALTGVRHLSGALATLRQRYARQARAAGMSWTAIAEALDLLTRDDALDGIDPGEAAFTWARTGHLVDPEPVGWWSRRQPALTWTCTSCAATVTDYGPYNHDPADDEHGHTPTCTRHHTDIRAARRTDPDPWDQDTDDDAQSDDDPDDLDDVDGVGVGVPAGE